MPWENYLSISYENFGQGLEMKYLDNTNKLALNWLSCEFLHHNSRTFSRKLAGKLNKLHNKVFKRNVNASQLRQSDLAMIVLNKRDEVVSCITATYAYSSHVNRQLGIVVQLDCTLPSYRVTDFIELKLMMLQDCVRELVLRGDDDDAGDKRLHAMLEIIQDDPTAIQELVLVFPCVRSNIRRIEQLKNIGLTESARSWGLDEGNYSKFAVFEHTIFMPSEPGSDEPEFPLLMRP
jgi:hypothetical protein